MIIFGTRGVTSTPERGRFHCPSCGGEHDYARKRVRRFFTLYFLPVLPLETVGEYIECGGCRGTFREEVLDYAPGQDGSADFEAEFEPAMRRVMALISLADGEVDEAEVQTMASIFGQLAGREIDATVVEDELERAQAEGGSVGDYLGRIGPRLNDHGKEMVLRAAFLVAAADGVFQEEEKRMLGEVGQALQMSAAHVNGVLTHLRDGGE
jgi:tellurite resistance protein